MMVSAKSLFTAGVAVVSASAIAIAPTFKAPPVPAPEPTVRLAAAQAQLAAMSFNPFSVTDWVERIVIPPSLNAPFPTPPQLQPPAINLQNIDSTVKAIYGAVEPWVAYGFDLAAYAVGWIPYVGWLAPQIPIFYNLVERIVRSAIFNTTEWLTGQGTFLQNLGQFGVDTANSFIFFANDQLAFWLPPLPPIPPIPGGSNSFAIPNAPALPQAVQTVQKQLTAPVDVVGNLAGTALGLPGNVQGSPLAAAPVVATQVTDLKPSGVLSGVAMSQPTGKPSPSTDTSNPLRKMDPFSITSAFSPSRDTTTTTPGSPNPVRDVVTTLIATTRPSAGTANLSPGNPSPSASLTKGRVPDAIKRVTGSLTHGTPSRSGAAS